MPLPGSPGHGVAKAGDVRSYPICVPPGYRVKAPGDLEQTLFEPDEGPSFTSREKAFENMRKLRVHVRIAAALLPATASKKRAKELAYVDGTDAVVTLYPWGISVHESKGMFRRTFEIARLPGDLPLAATCDVSFSAARGEAEKLPELAARADAICASLRDE